MSPREVTSRWYGQSVAMVEPEAKSQFARDLENAVQYFGDSFPGNEGLTCRECGVAVNLGWQHIAWHEAAA